jgi:hypothetical protein
MLMQVDGIVECMRFDDGDGERRKANKFGGGFVCEM